jgi:hypothetical protein
MRKSLVTYHPDKLRNRIFVQDFIPPYRNSSVIQLGDRTARDTKYWVTTYKNNHTGKTNTRPTNHVGIQTFKNKW